MPDRPKYSIAEVERRWLTDLDTVRGLLTGRPMNIVDRYLSGSRLRLRRVEDGNGDRVYKLCKKYGDHPAGMESITNLYLSREEFLMLQALPGWEVTKERFRVLGGSVDVYRGDGEGLSLFEREFAGIDAADDYAPPPFARREITADPTFSGAALAKRFGRLRLAGSE